VLASGAAAHSGCTITFASTERPASLTLAQIQADALRTAAALHRLGLRAGDVLAVQLPNWPETASLYFGAAALGLVLLPIVPTYGPSEVSFILRDANAKAFVMPARHRRADAVRDLARLGEQPSLDHRIVVGDPVPDDAIGWDDLRASGRIEIPPPPQDASALALIVYTSGTTAAPKGVQHSHDSVVAELRTSPTPPPDIPGTVSLQPFPAGHTAGLVAILAPAIHGYPTILMDVWDPHVAARLVAEHRVTAMAGTPVLVSTLFDAGDEEGLDLSTLRHGTTGGAGVPPSLIERVDARGFSLCRCYGATEGPSVTASPPNAPLEKRAYTDGRPLEGVRLRILDDTARDLGAGEQGEIAVIAPESFIGYTDPALNEAAFTDDGFFLTGDIGYVDADGYLTITDRKKDIIIRGGENISSKEVEDVLVRHPGVHEAAVVAFPDPRLGERVCAFLVCAPGSELSLEDVRRHFEEEGVARHKTPERLELVDGLPRTPAGKVRKPELRQRVSGAIPADR